MNPTDPADLDRVIAGMSEAQKEAVSTARLYISGRYRVLYNYAGPIMKNLTKLGILGDRDGRPSESSSYLTPLGLAIRARLGAGSK